MIEKISFQYPWWFIIFCILAGALYAWLMYRKESRFDEGPKWLKPVMAGLRFFAISTIALLLLGLIIKSLKEDRKDPIVIFADDHSASIPSATNQKLLTEFDQGLAQLKESLGKKYQVESIGFGGEIMDDSIKSYKAASTNLSAVVQYIYENYADQNVGAVILSSDGIYNEGSNPVYTNAKFNAPFHTIALGDTLIRKDVSIKNVLHNKLAYLGDKFSLQVDITAHHCQGSASRLKIEKVSDKGRQLIQEIPFTIDANNYFKSFDIAVNADQTGIVKYSITILPVNGELSLVNNKKDIYIEILDGRQKILILANAPHPDISALNNLITNNKNYQVKTAFVGDEKVNIGEYNLVVFHNLPSQQHDISTELAAAKSKQIPQWFIAGSQINASKFNLVQDVVRIRSTSQNVDDTEPSINSGFNSFTISEGLKSQLSRSAPMTSMFGVYEAVAGAEVLLYQKIKKIPTKYPLFAFADKSGIRTAVTSGEGIWKWKLNDFVDNGNNEKIGELVNKCVQFVTVKDDKRKFRVNLPKNLFKENESIVFDAQLYNDAYEMVNDGDVSISIKNQDRKEFKYNFSKTNNYYTLDAGLFPEGNYTYTATTLYKGSPLTANGRFSVEAIQLEQYDLTARHDVLKSLSNKFNGKMYYPSNMASIEEAISSNQSIKPMIFQSSQSKSLLNYKWLFFLILTMLSIEWFLRRYYGSY